MVIVPTAGKPPVRVRAAPEVLADEDILEMVHACLIRATVVDNYLAELWSQVFDRIKPYPEVTLRTNGQIAWAIRRDQASAPWVKTSTVRFEGDRAAVRTSTIITGLETLVGLLKQRQDV